MSSMLYRLGRYVACRPRLVLGAWVLVLALVGVATGLLAQGTDDTIHIPGAESTDSLEHLRQVFPELAGSSVTVAVEAAEGRGVDTPTVRAALAATGRELTATGRVVYLADPFGKDATGQATTGQISPDGKVAVLSAYLDVDPLNVTPELKTSVYRVGDRLSERLGTEGTVHLGGDALGTTIPKVTVAESLGLIVALVVLMLMFGSFVAAGMPMLTALFGAAMSMSGIYLATAFTQIMSSTPVLALMLGLAVGIDYALFVLARHRDQLGSDGPEGGLDVAESVARATATAGSAVLVAGITVVIALVGLFVADMPFLTTMGLAAAGGVAVAVAVSLTALPALMVLAGERLRPRAARKKAAAAPTGGSMGRWWVQTVTARPLMATLLVVGGLALTALPAKDLRLALPDSGALDRGTPARVTYELLAEHFGPGYNAPLLLMVDVLPSTDPIGVTNKIAAELRALPGVASVPLATPNRTGDTSIVQVIPTTAGDDPETARLVDRIRALVPGIKARYGLTSSVTGLTAVTIDLSQKLAGALVPFGLFVVGLSVVLLATVFRSVAVPLSAALGYLLSVGAAFGLTSLVWMHGLFADALAVQHVGSVMAFLPILLMGVLFGLAMDYQMFLVSRMREHHVHHGDAAAAVTEGFAASSKVVTAAAVIMFAVFASFVPEGTADTKPIAFSLAVGVVIDAFLVRMTLIPAILALLGERAWWLPRWAENLLPTVDAEGEGLVRELRARGEAGAAVTARHLSLHDEAGQPIVDDVTFTVDPGRALLVSGPARTALLLTLGGRVAAHDGDLVVCGHVLPGRRRAVRRTSVLVPPDAPDPYRAAGAALDAGTPLLLLDGADRLTDHQRRALAERLTHLAEPLAPVDGGTGVAHRTAVVVGCTSPATAALWSEILPGAGHLDLPGSHPLLEAPR